MGRVSLSGVIVGLGVMASLSLSAQQEGEGAVPRTPWGEPDLQGTWTNETITPFERPVALGDKAVLTPEEAQAVEQQSADQRAKADDTVRPGDVGSYNQAWFASGTKVVSTRQTSLVVEPANGRVPLLQETERRWKENAARIGDAPEFMSPWDRCITRGVPGGFFPAGYNNAYRIFQLPGQVIIYYEMIHAARIIPTDGRSHLPSQMRFWDGDSVGRWEGDTLVVDVTNYNGKGWIATNAAAGRIRGVGQSESLHVVERFKRVDAETIHYDVTIDDPKLYSQPWKVAIPLTRDDAYQLFEYACHEGNHAVGNVLRASRALEGGKAGGK